MADEFDWVPDANKPKTIQIDENYWVRAYCKPPPICRKRSSAKTITLMVLTLVGSLFAIILLVSFFRCSPYILIYGVGLLIYFIPAAMAYSNGHINRDAVLALNLLLGWTFLGWVIALVWASMASQRK